MHVSHSSSKRTVCLRQVRHLEHGFTLIELMIVVAVVGILAAISFPIYSEHIRRSRVSDAVTLLAQYQLSMEQASQDNGNYGVTSCAVALPAATSTFKLSCVLGANGQTFVATATGIDAMAGHIFTVNDAGARRTTAYVGATALPTACWLTGKGGC